LKQNWVFGLAFAFPILFGIGERERAYARLLSGALARDA